VIFKNKKQQSRVFGLDPDPIVLCRCHAQIHAGAEDSAIVTVAVRSCRFDPTEDPAGAFGGARLMAPT
jgi:hypothetical protein